MRISESESSLRRELQARGLGIETSDAEAVITAMIDWYEGERVEDAVTIEDDGDQLLFQWGTYDWGAGPAFEVSMTRQLIEVGGDDPSIRQLEIRYRYPVSSLTVDLARDAWWCHGPDDVPGFRDDVASTDVAGLLRSTPPISATLVSEAVD